MSYMDGITGDDGLSSCVSDLNKWSHCLRSGKIINTTSLAQMYTPHKLASGAGTNYGYGVMIRRGDGIENLTYHTGSWPGYTTLMLNLEESNQQVFILSNNYYDDQTFLADEIITTLLR